AKRLINNSDMPLAEIAFAAGFGSVRRFNDAFRATYSRPPSSFRADGRGTRAAASRRGSVTRASLHSAIPCPAPKTGFPPDALRGRLGRISSFPLPWAILMRAPDPVYASRSAPPIGRGHSLQLEAITHRFGATAAVWDVSLEVNAGELVALLGPSGC